MVWIHPALGALAVATFLWLGVQGLTARKKRKDAPASRARHRRWSRWVFGLMVVAGLGGTASVYLLRDDLEPTRSLHFWVAWFTVMVAAGLAWSGPEVPRDEDARRLHPLFGAIAMAGAALTAAMGMGLLPD
jgi:threonine/homoserine/homoserine lactone efflux protein